MKTPRQVVREETMLLIPKIAILGIISVLISFIAGIFSLDLFLGLLIGCVYSVINFYLIGLSVQEAVKLSDAKDVAKYMTSGYVKRYFLTALVIAISIYVDFINPFGVMISLFFPKAAIYFSTIFRKEAS